VREAPSLDAESGERIGGVEDREDDEELTEYLSLTSRTSNLPTASLCTRFLSRLGERGSEREEELELEERLDSGRRVKELEKEARSCSEVWVEMSAGRGRVERL